MLIYERGSVTFQNKKARLLTLLKFVIVLNPQLVAVWNLALASMESMLIALYGIKSEGDEEIHAIA